MEITYNGLSVPVKAWTVTLDSEVARRSFCYSGTIADPQGPPVGFCQNKDCGIKLQSRASIEAGYCPTCREKRALIGPERPKG